MTEHRITIPGFDYDYCGRCGKYLIRDVEIARLENLIATAMARNRGKEAQELRGHINREKQLRNQPCLTTQKNQTPPGYPAQTERKNSTAQKSNALRKSARSAKNVTGL
jgi:hypothetical protein